MGWVDKPHVCDLPFVVVKDYKKIGDYFECDHCQVAWKVVGISTIPDENHFWVRLTFRRIDPRLLPIQRSR